jgi:hypothetical protein
MPRLSLLLALAFAACSRSSAPTPTPTPSPAPAPSPTPAPSSPLACRSLSSRTAEAQSLYGADVHLATVDGTFLFVDPDRTPLFADTLRFAPRALAALRHERIAPRPLCPVSVYVFGSVAHFKGHCVAAGRHDLPESGHHYGVHDRDRGEIVIDLSEGAKYVPTLSHELAHVLMDADWEAPLWFRECVASLYESPVLPDDAHGVIHGTDDWRYTQLRTAVAAHDPAASLGALFGMSDDEFRGRSDAGGTDGTLSLLHRGAARATCQWLDGQDELWPMYRAWRDGREDDPEGVAAFTRVVGAAPTAEAEEKAWEQWVGRTRS